MEVMEGTGSDKMYREERGREGEAESDQPRQIPSHAKHNNKRQEVNNDSRKAEHKLEGWINSHKADWAGYSIDQLLADWFERKFINLREHG